MHKKGITLLVFFILFSFSLGFTSVNPDSLLILIPSAHDTIKINLYNQLYIYYQNMDGEKSLEYINESLKIAKKINDKKQIGQTLLYKAHIYERRGFIDKAISFYNEALDNYLEIEHQNGISATYSNIGASYIDKGDYMKALNYILKALKIIEKADTKNDLARCYNNIGLIHYYQADYQKALDFYNKSLEIRIEIDDKDGIALAYNNIGIVYFYQNKLDKVLEYFFKSLEIYEALNDLRGQSRPLFNIAEIYSEQGRFNDAIEYFNKSLNIDIQLGDTSSFAETYKAIGNIYLKLGQKTKALKYQEMALTLMLLTDHKYGLMGTHEALSETFEKLGNYKSALKHYKMYSEIYDSIYNEEKAKALAEIETKYETEKKEEEIELLNKAKELQEISIQHHKEKAKKRLLLIIIFGIGLFIILIYSYFLFRLLSRNKEKTNLLTERNHEINQQTEELQAALNMISDQKIELLKANEEIVETTKAKEIFLANTTHEIRTPVSIISGFANLLLSTNINKTQSRYLKNINNSAHNLLVVINDILTFSKIEAGKLTIESIEFNLREVINNYFESIDITAKDKNLNFSYTTDNEIPENLVGDPVRLQQIISNLVGNAIKFTPKGGEIVTTIEKIRENSTETGIKFSVKDNGIGIEEDKLEKIFESFTQADKATSRKYGGTGLGLSIVKKLVQLQNGEINVTSKLNSGSTFSFIIPYKKMVSPKPIGHSPVIKIDHTKTKNINVLIADDNPVNIELLIDMFRNYDSSIKVETVNNGKSAINKLRKYPYHILLLDIQMPIMDGFKTAEYIRKNLPQPANKIPIIALSAFADDAQKNKCIKGGMNGYLAKPFEPHQLFVKISNLVGIAPKHETETKKTDKELIIPGKKLKLVNLDFLQKTYNNQNDKIINILNICLQDIPKQINKLSESYDQRKMGNVQIAAHSLKTTLNYLGLTELTTEAKAIEQSILQNKKINEIPKRIANISQTWEQAVIEIKSVINSIK